MNLKIALEGIKNYILDPKVGLPEEIFLFITQLTPMVNVDLLIKNKQGQVLLAWRDDEFCGKGWHIPGGIVRIKERFHERIEKVAEEEIGCRVTYNPTPIAINELINNQVTRGHFISFLYECYVPDNFIIDNKALKNKDVGFIKWHDYYPHNMINVHKIYRKYFERK